MRAEGKRPDGGDVLAFCRNPTDEPAAPSVTSVRAPAQSKGPVRPACYCLDHHRIGSRNPECNRSSLIASLIDPMNHGRLAAVSFDGQQKTAAPYGSPLTAKVVSKTHLARWLQRLGNRRNLESRK